MMMRRLRAPEPPPSAPHHLEGLLHGDETAFLDALLCPVDPAALAGLPYARLMHAAIAADRPRAAQAVQDVAARGGYLAQLPRGTRSREELGELGWSARKPMLALAQVALRRKKVPAYIRRFPHAAQAWRVLVHERCLSPVAYMAQFGVDVGLLNAWWRADLLQAPALAQLLRRDPDMALGWVRDGRLPVVALLRDRVDRAERDTWVRPLLQAGLVLPAAWVRAHPWFQDYILGLRQAGEVSADTYLAHVPRPLLHDLQALERAGRSTAWHRLRAGHGTVQELTAEVEHGRHTPESLASLCPLPDSLAQAWLAAGTLEPQRYAHTSLAHWRVDDPLPAVHVQQAQRALGPYLLLRDLILPAAPEVRRAYALRMMATHLAHKAASTGHAAGTPPADACLVCFEPFDRAHPAGHAAECAHAPNVCSACLLQQARQADVKACPDSACRAPLLPDDVLRWGGTHQDADMLARDAVRRLLSTRPMWLPCVTEGCVGGTLPFLHTGPTFCCRICEQVSPVSVLFDWRRDREQVIRLVEGLAAPRAGAAVIRECPGEGCGAPIEHNGGCQQMRCDHCGQSYNFSSGLAASMGLFSEQSYVPVEGLLQRAGLYEGLPPGAMNVANLRDLVLAQAARLALDINSQALALTP